MEDNKELGTEINENEEVCEDIEDILGQIAVQQEMSNGSGIGVNVARILVKMW